MRIKQVVLNLLSNGIEFSASDTQILLRYSQRPEHDPIVVIDHGTGIAPERIFERFEQLAPAG